MLSSTLLQSPIAWIGVGKMGLPLITHLLNAGVVVHIYDPSTERAELSRALGAIVHLNIQSLLLQSKYIFSSLPNDQVLIDVATSQHGVLPLAQPGSTFTDTSTVSVSASEQVATCAKKFGVNYVRVALSGNPTVAKAGQLTIMASGDQSSYESILPLLKLVGSNHFFLGNKEQARLMKLVINLMISVSAGMIAEALALGRKGGLDWQQMLEVMETSAVASPMVKYKTPILKDRDFTSTMSAIAQTKDIDLILDAAKIHGVPLHLTVTLRQMYQALIAQGDGEDDYIAIVKQVERSAGLNVDGVIK